MKKILIACLAIVGMQSAFAQVVVVPPSSDYRVTWVHAGLNVEYYQVRTSPAAPWVNVGKPAVLQMALPAGLMPGTYGAQVRACASGNLCSAASPSAVFTIAAPQPQAPAVPTGVTVEKIASLPDPQPQPQPQPTGTPLFTSGWENGPIGCGAQMLDGIWADYGGSGACNGTVHDADIVSDVHHDGAYSLRVTQKPGTSGTGDIYNGTDFRIVSRSFGAQAELTLMFWVRYDSNYRWASADHKIALLMGGDTQNIYINYRGGADSTHPRLCFYPLANDTFFCQTAGPYVSTNAWYRIRVHVMTGAHGRVEMFLKPEGQAEAALTLTRDAGNGATVPTDVNTGTIDAIKLDTTYNSGASITQNMFQWYDSVSVYRGLVQ